MSKFPPIKGFIRISLVLAIIIGLLSFVFLSIANVKISKAAIFCLMGSVTVFLIGIMNIYILKIGRPSSIETRQKRNWEGYFLSYLVSPVIYLIVWTLFYPFTDLKAFPWLKVPFSLILIISSWLFNTLIQLLYNFNYFQYFKVQTELENLQLKASLSETALIVLKQQIHPHFLFNVLTNIKSLYKGDAQKGETYLVHLANFLRASITSQTVKLARLADEIQLCDDYIQMQKIRFGCALIYTIDLSASTIQQGSVPFFAIQTLLENAIKHNDLTEKKPLHIVVQETEGYIQVRNNVQPKKFKEASTGQGLANLTERYRLLANDEILINQDDYSFSVSIKILKV